MGYEIKIYLGNYHKINFKDEDDACFFSQVAWLDLCKPDYNDSIARIETDDCPRVYFYGMDGNTRIDSDPYGEYLKAVPAQKVLEELKKDWEKSKKQYQDEKIGYRRYYMAIELLKRFIETFQGENPSVVIYGH